MVSDQSVRMLGTQEENSLPFESLIEGFHGGIFILDDQFRVVFLNEELLRMFDGPREKVIGQDFRVFLQDDFLNIAETRYLDRQHGKDVPVKYELCVKDSRGELHNVEISASTYTNSDGRRETICHLIDLTDKQRAINDLVESEQRLKIIFEHAPDAYYITDRTGKFIDGNKAAETISGYSREEFIGKEFLSTDILSPDQIEIARDLLERCAQKQNTFPVEFTLNHKSGKRIDLEVRTVPYSFGGEDVILCVARDITDRRKTERQLSRLASIIEQVDISVVLANLNGTVIYVNPACAKAMNRSVAKIIGRNFREGTQNVKNDEVLEEMWTSITSGKSWNGMLVREKKDGSTSYEDATVFPVRNELGEVTNYAAVYRDISDEMILKEQVQQKQRLESIGQMASGVAHDFNNILSVIMGYAEMGLAIIPPEEKTWQYMNELAKAGKRASDLTKQLLAFSRKQVIEPKIINVEETISDLGQMFSKLIGEDIQVEMELSCAQCQIKADPSQIEQIIINLVVNARDAIQQKYVHKDGSKLICIKTYDTVVDSPQLSTPFEIDAGRYVVIEVIDNGTGISPEIINKIFDPFFTTKDPGKGTGLGLSTVYGIVKQNKGALYMDSTPGNGTAVKIYWPLFDQPARINSSDRTIKNTSQGQEVILVVEDDEQLRTFIASIFTSLGYQVFTANDGKQAKQFVGNGHRSIDLLLSDVVMPEFNGCELAKYFRTVNPHIKVLLTSGYSEQSEFAKDACDEGFSFIQKPFSARVLGEKVRQLLDN